MSIGFAQFFASWLTVAVLISGGSDLIPVVAHLIAIPAGVIMWAASPLRNMTREEFDAEIVNYLPWPSWMPGYRPDGRGKQRETQGVSDDDLVRTGASTNAIELERRSGSGAARHAPNPFQRLSIRHPLTARLLGAAFLIGLPANIFGGLRVASVAIGTACLLAVFWHLAGGLRRMSERERGDRTVVYLPWASWLPGWVDDESSPNDLA